MCSVPAGSTTILVVDDSENVRAVLTTILDAEGYRVEKAVDGLEALDLALGSAVSLILLDVGMPGLDGPAFCRAYREQGGRAPVVVITASGGEQAAAAATACEAVARIAKPFEIDDLLETVERHVNRPT